MGILITTSTGAVCVVLAVQPCEIPTKPEIEHISKRFCEDGGEISMSDDAYGATVAKRRLSRRLAELRGASGYTANHVCDILNWGRGKVGRFEANQWKRPEMSDIRDLVRIYEIEGAEREEIEELAVRCRVRPWWRELRRDLR